MIPVWFIIVGVILFLVVLGLIGYTRLIHICEPNQVLIFSGGRRRSGDRRLGYHVIKGGRRVRYPLIERVDRLDLTNMVIDIQAQNAYSRGGIPLTVQGVANVKIAGHEPLLNNAIERFNGKGRQEIMQIAKATLEGSLRGILATMTPEQVNEDKLLFAERLVADVEQDMTALGLVVDTMKIQNVSDEVNYLDSIGRVRNAEIISKARVAEAIARADSIVRSAENEEREQKAAVEAEIAMAKANAQKRLTDAQTQRAALVAEEQAQVMAAVARAKAEVEVQKARIEQIRGQLEADVVQPARASAEAAANEAKAQTAGIIEDGRARAEALRRLATIYRESGPNAREILLTQKLEGVIEALTNVIPATHVEKVTMIDGGGGSLPGKALGTLEQIKQVFGVDVIEKINSIGERPAVSAPTPAPAPRPVPPVEAQEAPEAPIRIEPRRRAEPSIVVPPPPKG
jgi:flotillin